MRRQAARGPGHCQALGGSLELGPCPVMPCEPRTPRAGKPENSPGKVYVRSERPRTRACGGWVCGPRAEASCPAVGLTGGWHAGGQRGGRLRNMRRRPPRAPPRPAACLSPGQAEPTGGPTPPRTEPTHPGDAPSHPLCRRLSCHWPSRASRFFPLFPCLGVSLTLPGRP